MKILVGLSGGVDSSVAAAMLKEQGHEVIGATMAIWGREGIFKQISEKFQDFHKSHGACLGPNEKEDIEDARRIAREIGIPFFVFDCSKHYEEIVLNNFKNEYLSGRTPNPCVWCNALIKFDLLPKLAIESGIDFDKFATGHYARVEKNEEEKYCLKTAKDIRKDQSYFLYRLTQAQLENIILPLGNYTKEEIRAYAQKIGLDVAQKPDSQDFYEGDYNELLEVQDKEGNIVDENGKILGTHKGFWNYTIGQRRGLKISAEEPLYVTELRKNTNEVVIGKRSSKMKSGLIASDLNWILPQKKTQFACRAKIRSSSKTLNAAVTTLKNEKIKVEFEDLQSFISPGQSVVLYKNDVVLGGGIIDEAF